MINSINSAIHNKLAMVSFAILLASFCQSAIGAQITNEQKNQLIMSAKVDIESTMPKIIADVVAENQTNITTSQSQTLATLLLPTSSK
ncbi:hypothetical protein [Colwellia sp. 20A7]|uniref:hypothetical protein n=1 Tax=Colwellia sp. 20A7 TaxID=2689569 RepID=UPI001357D4F9|nr:hypothetical protein [Colwellia sp. 20A7]